MKKTDVAVLGQINLDISVLGFLDGMVQQKESLVPDISLQTGGDAQNVAAVLASLGLGTKLLGRVGDDEAGELCLSRTAARGVGCAAVSRIPGGRTGTCVDLVRDGEAAFLYTPGENARLALADVPLQEVRGAAFLGLHSLYAMPGLDAKTLLAEAKSAGTRTFADTTNIHPGDSIGEIAALLPLLDYFAPSYAEAAVLLGLSEPRDIAEKLLALGVGTAIIKMGGEGCFVATKEGGLQVPGYPADVVDTTGAGDSFCAGFLYGLVRGLPLETCAKLANAAGAISVGKLGATGAITGAAQLQAKAGL